jgi:hypothetical protein
MTNSLNLPAGTKRFKNCSIEIDNLDTALFEKETDKRKRFHNARQRQFVFSKYAGRANADGSSCFPSTKTLAAKAKMSERQFRYWTEDLVELGFIINLGYRTVGDTATRERLLLVPARIAALICTPMQDSVGGGCKIEGVGVQDRDKKSSYLAYNPPVLPANNPPSLPATLLAGLETVFAKSTGTFLKSSRADKQKLLTLSAKVETPIILSTFQSWTASRNLEGLNYPLGFFVAEFDAARAIADKKAVEAKMESEDDFRARIQTAHDADNAARHAKEAAAAEQERIDAEESDFDEFGPKVKTPAASGAGCSA